MAISGRGDRRKISDLAKSRHNFESRWPIAEAIMNNARKSGQTPPDDKVKSQIAAGERYLRQDIQTQRDIIETASRKGKRQRAERRLAEQQFLLAGVRAVNMQFGAVNIRELGQRPAAWQESLQGTQASAEAAAQALMAGDVSAGDTLEEALATYVGTMVALAEESGSDEQTIEALHGIVLSFEENHARRHRRTGREAAKFVKEVAAGLQSEIVGQNTAMGQAETVVAELVVKQLNLDPDFESYGYNETLRRESTWGTARSEVSAVSSSQSGLRSAARDYVNAFEYIDGFDSLLSRLESDVQSAMYRLDRANNELDSANHAYSIEAPSIERALDRAHYRLRDYQREASDARQRYRRADRRRDNLRDNVKRIRSSINQAENRISRLQREIEQAGKSDDTKHKIPGLRSQLQTARSNKRDYESQLGPVQSELREARDRAERFERQWRRASSLVNDEEREIRHLQSQLDHLLGRIQSAEWEVSSASSALQSAESAVDSAHQRLAREQRTVEQAPSTLEASAQALGRSIRAYEGAIRQLNVNDSDKQAMSLEEIMPDPAAIRASAETGRAGARQLLGRFGQQVGAITQRSDLATTRINQAQSDREAIVAKRLAEVRAPLH